MSAMILQFPSAPSRTHSLSPADLVAIRAALVPLRGSWVCEAIACDGGDVWASVMPVTPRRPYEGCAVTKAPDGYSLTDCETWEVLGTYRTATEATQGLVEAIGLRPAT